MRTSLKHSILALCLLFVAPVAWGQVIGAVTRDAYGSFKGSPPSPAPNYWGLNNAAMGVYNTGTDVAEIEDLPVQVTVYDGTSSNLSLQVGVQSLTGSNTNSNLTALYDFKDSSGATVQLEDPDVVISPRPIGEYHYVTVVGIVTYAARKRVLVSVYEYHPSGPSLSHVPSQTFTLSNGGVCSNPNIDVNNMGEVAVVWSEVELKLRTVTITIDNIQFGPFTTTFPVGDVYLAVGRADGSGRNGSGQIQGNHSSANTGDPVRYYTNCSGEVAGQGGLCHLGNAYQRGLYPDVSISKRGDIENGDDELLPVVSIAFVSNRYQLMDYEKKLIVKQLTYDNTDSVAQYDQFQDASFTSRPRIAAPPSNDITAFELVQSNISTTCTEETDFKRTAYIHNWGKANNTLRYTPTKVNDLDIIFYDNTIAVDPVVTFYNTIAEEPEEAVGQNQYTISWAWVNGSSGLSTDAAGRFDVLAATLANGVVLHGAYNYVNRQIHGTGVATLKGDQMFPSIAGRHLINSKLAFAHYSSSATYSPVNSSNNYPGPRYYIAIKISDNEAGVNPFRQAEKVDPNGKGNVEIFPNPTSGEISINMKAGAGEEITSLRVTDLAGRVVEKHEVAKPSSSLNWKPKHKLPAGLYSVQITTNKAVIRQQVVVE